MRFAMLDEHETFDDSMVLVDLLADRYVDRYTAPDTALDPLYALHDDVLLTDEEYAEMVA